MWRLQDDDSQPVSAAAEQIHSAHRMCHLKLPKTAILFFMSKGPEYLTERYAVTELPELFPCFLRRRPVWQMNDWPICFLFGGSGAPQAADSVETLAALGVKNIIAVGMFGAFSADVQLGEIVVPRKAFVEEGTSLHYYESIEAAQPDPTLHRLLMDTLQKRDLSIVSTDAVYRQTFRKEQLWRERGAVGVDMETSAVFSVSQYLGLRAAALLMASDLHPSSPDAPKWQWLMTADMRYDLTEQALAAAKAVCYEGD